MIIDALTNPPVPEYTDLNENERNELRSLWEVYSCPHSCGGCWIDFYNGIRKVLKAREKRVFQATMTGPPDWHFQDHNQEESSA